MSGLYSDFEYFPNEVINDVSLRVLQTLIYGNENSTRVGQLIGGADFPNMPFSIGHVFVICACSVKVRVAFCVFQDIT